MRKPSYCLRMALALLIGLGLASTADAQDSAVAFTNAIVETAGKAGRIENATVVLRNGKIEAVGPAVTRLSVGDRVFGTVAPHFGAHAQYVCLPEHAAVAG